MTVRFTLRPGQWYACLLLGDEFDSAAMCSLSPTPIRVERVKPLSNGKRMFELAFFHANYPEGVQGKLYTLRTIHRGERGLLAESTEHEPPRFLHVTDISLEWLKHNFPNYDHYSKLPHEVLNRAHGL